MKKTKESKRIDKAVEDAFNTHGKGFQKPMLKFHILDLGKIHDAGVAAAQAGQDIEAAVIAAIAKYRFNDDQNNLLI